MLLVKGFRLLLLFLLLKPISFYVWSDCCFFLYSVKCLNLAFLLFKTTVVYYKYFNFKLNVYLL